MAGPIPKIDPVGTRDTFEQSFGLTDPESGGAIDISSVTAIVFDIIDPDSQIAMLTASIGSGVTLESDDDGAVFTVRFESSSMGTLASKNYDIRVVITKDGDDIELFGTLSVVS